ncbi:MAG: hypothetical protein H0X66_13170 [Verrucomicrobia bacterium]|nr:hypothetical protein [Verrucomicrobiota bacterium]
MKKHLSVLALTFVCLFFVVAAKENKAKTGGLQVYRVDLGPTRTPGDSHNLIFFIETGATSEPMVCLADNGGYPSIRNVYAKAMKFKGRDGVRVAVLFDQVPTGNGLSINVLQPGMRSNYKVSRLDESLPNRRVVE